MNLMRNEKNAHKIAVVLQWICAFMAFLAVIIGVMALLGRLEITFLTTPEGYQGHGLMFEKDHSATTRFFTVRLNNPKINLNTAGSGGEIGFITWLAISLIGIAKVFPMGFAFYLMSKFFKNISETKVFVTENAKLLLKSGTVMALSCFAVPILSTFVLPAMVNNLTANVLRASTSPNMTEIFYGAILIVMAYVFHYGIYLQEEVDYTL